MLGYEHPAITERSARRSLERSKLRIKRVRQAEVIVVEKRNELRTTGENPGIARLEPDLLYALRVAASKAADDGIELTINSGWRSRNYQDALLRAAVAEYGSVEEAERWVATADTSPHVSGDAVDVGSVAATTWLSKHGAAYGLCQIYRNEAWHFELRPESIAHGCPRMYADPTHDPRMQK